MSATGAIFVKELRVEFRNKQTINSYLILAILILAAFRFAFSTFEADQVELAAPFLWITIFFAGMFSMTPSYKREVDGGTREGLLLAPVPASAIYFGKLTAQLLIVFGLELFTLVVFFAFFPYDMPDPPVFGAILVLGTLAFVALGSIISAISSNLSQAEVMLPVLLVPLLLFTVVMPAVSATGKIFSGGGFGDVSDEIRLLIASSAIFIGAGYILIDYILEA
jgi:heme exporter protein B